MKKRIIAVVMAAMMVMAVLPSVSLAAWKNTDLPVGIDLNAMNTRDLDGNAVTGELFANGKSYTILSVWATWAGPAKDSLVHLQEFYSDIDNSGENGINVVGVLFEDAASTARSAKSALNNLGIEFPTVHMDSMLRDLYNASFEEGAVTAVPVHYLVDRNGVVVDCRIGSLDDENDVITWITLRAKPAHGDRDVDENSRGMNISAMNTTDLDGNVVTGKVFAESKLTLLNVWATWCAPCMGEMKLLEQLSESDLDVNVMGILLQDQRSTVETARKMGPAYKSVLFDKVLENMFEESFNGGYNTAIPVSYLIDSNGTVVAAKLAAFTSYADLEEWVSTYLAMPAPDTSNREGEVECDVTYTNVLYGDLNGDLKVEAADATIVLRSVIGNCTLTEEQMVLGDLNGNNKIDSGDAGLILKAVVGSN